MKKHYIEFEYIDGSISKFISKLSGNDFVWVGYNWFLHYIAVTTNFVFRKWDKCIKRNAKQILSTLVILDTIKMSNVLSPMSNFYCGKTILLTGGSGFLGQLFIQKLLRIKIACLYLLLRPKKNEITSQRLNKLFEDAVFDKLKLEVPNFMEKIKVIEGSLDQDGLGISEHNRKDIIQNVQLVIHSAADVRFNRSLIEIIHTNLKGTEQLLMLSKGMQKLQLFTYISTCYSNCGNLKIIEEKFYDPPMSPNLLIDLLQKISLSEKRKDIFDTLTTKFIHPWPNTYTFSKAMSESMCRSFQKDFPIAILRPSIIISTWKDPEAGWINGYFGLTGLVYSTVLGISRVIFSDNSKTFDVICADMVVNSTLGAMWTMGDHQMKNRDEMKAKIFNIASGRSNPFTMEIFNRSCVFTNHIPISLSVWCTFALFSANETLFTVFSFLLHFIPGAIFDFFFKCAGMKMRLLPIYRNIMISSRVTSYFSIREWMFMDDNMQSVYEKMTEYDKKLFPSDTKDVDWYNVLYDMVHGFRKYLAKDSGNWESAFRRQENLKRIHYTFLTFLLGIFIFVIYYLVVPH